MPILFYSSLYYIDIVYPYAVVFSAAPERLCEALINCERIPRAEHMTDS